MSDYAETGHRKTKRDKKAKARYKPYKKGGKYRSKNVEEGKKK